MVKHRGLCNSAGLDTVQFLISQSAFSGKNQQSSTARCMQPGLSMSPPYDIQERSFLFACRIIGFCRSLSASDLVVRRLSWQLLDASTSVGANLEEADTGQTKKDFIAKVSIARKETAEARYWLRLIRFAQPTNKEHIDRLVDESHQLLKILTTIIKNAEANPNRAEH